MDIVLADHSHYVSQLYVINYVNAHVSVFVTYVIEVPNLVKHVRHLILIVVNVPCVLLTCKLVSVITQTLATMYK